MFVCVCVCVKLPHLILSVVFTGRKSAAANFDLLTETLRETRNHKLALEECKVKLQEEHLAFERQQWHARHERHAILVEHNEDEYDEYVQDHTQQ